MRASEIASMPTGSEVLWEPTSGFVAASPVGAYLRWLADNGGPTVDEYSELWRWSVSELPGFWGSIWDHFGVIGDRGAVVLEGSAMPGARWFPGATLNYAENMLAGADGQVVLIARSQTRDRITITRGQLRELVASTAAGLRTLGVTKGDRVAGYLPNIPEAVIAMLATASIGAVWASCAPEFGTRGVIDRFRQVAPAVLIAVDGYRYGAREVDRTAAVEAIRSSLPTLKATVTVPYLRADRHVPDGVAWSTLVSQRGPTHFEPVSFGHPLWILFSSGTTGLPKAITHSHGGIVVELLKSHALHSGLGGTDRYFVYATTSWVMWNILVSALLVGASIVLMDGNPSFPDPSCLWRIVADEQVTAYGCGAALLLQSAVTKVRPGNDFDLGVLRSVTSTGSPLPADAFRWVYREVRPDIFLQSMSGGTDVCGAFVGGSPMLPVRAGRIACRCLGVDAHAVDAAGRSVIGVPGELVIDTPMPSMPIFFWADPEGRRYRETYFGMYPGRWRHGDWVTFDEDGSCEIHGRSDGTLNRGGVRLGTAEFYNVLAAVPGVTDSMVLHLEDPAGGLGKLLLFVELQNGVALDEELRGFIVAQLVDQLSPRHAPDRIVAVPQIPYNHTGKKLEIPMKRILQGASRAEVLSDAAVRNPAAIDTFEELAHAL
jgi:acetoacetyl-CoA synthetase